MFLNENIVNTAYFKSIPEIVSDKKLTMFISEKDENLMLRYCDNLTKAAKFVGLEESDFQIVPISNPVRLSPHFTSKNIQKFVIIGVDENTFGWQTKFPLYEVFLFRDAKGLKVESMNLLEAHPEKKKMFGLSLKELMK